MIKQVSSLRKAFVSTSNKNDDGDCTYQYDGPGHRLTLNELGRKCVNSLSSRSLLEAVGETGETRPKSKPQTSRTLVYESYYRQQRTSLPMLAVAKLLMTSLRRDHFPWCMAALSVDSNGDIQPGQENVR